MAKRGRPKLNRPKFDTGTPELTMKRLQAVGPARMVDGKMVMPDPALSTTPLDALKARGLISAEAHGAALYFNALRKMVFGKAHPSAIDLTAVSSGGLPEELDVAGAERKYRAACAYVQGQSHAAFFSLENLVVHEAWAPWIGSRHGGTIDRDQRNCMTGFAALLGWYRGHMRKAA